MPGFRGFDAAPGLAPLAPARDAAGRAGIGFAAAQARSGGRETAF